MPPRSFTNAAVASSHPLASEAGTRVLKNGGNVVDAAVATSAMLCVTQNNMCGLGGDFFGLIKMNGKVYGLNGSGAASENATINFYKDKNLRAIPSRGPLGAITVPGLVDSWSKLLSRFGTMKISELLQPAIVAAKDGFEISSKYCSSIAGSFQALGIFEGWRNLFYPDRKVPKSGSKLVQSDLANSLSDIVSNGTDDFYRGKLAKKIVTGIRSQGGILDENDFASHNSFWDDPISTTYRGLRIFETAPNSQGATVLLWLNMLENYDLKNMGPSEFLEVYLSTCIRAYQERAKWISDPAEKKLPGDFLTKEFAKRLLSSDDLSSLLRQGKPDLGDTTYFCVAKSNGDAVSAIQSNYMGFGSGLVPAGTGFVLQNRGCYFTLDNSHHNALAPRKRTFHTLCACLGENADGATKFCLGSMGGDVQPQVQIHLLTRIVDRGLAPQEAIDLPRFVIPFTIYQKPAEILFEPGSSEESDSSELTLRRFRLQRRELGKFSSLTGHAQTIVFEDENTLSTGADLRGDGMVSGF